ncbi:MAG: hypothetical protein WCO60_13920 [Verrucomicrobiota bacterium]
MKLDPVNRPMEICSHVNRFRNRVRSTLFSLVMFMAVSSKLSIQMYAVDALASTGFRNNQGPDWYYKIASDAPLNPSQRMPIYSNNTWTAEGAIIGSNFQIPKYRRDSVREWRASSPGVIRITGRPNTGNGAIAGNGVEVEITKNITRDNGKSLWFKQMPNSDDVGYSHDIKEVVKTGDTIQFVVRCGHEDTSDICYWDPMISYLIQGGSLTGGTNTLNVIISNPNDAESNRQAIQDQLNNAKITTDRNSGINVTVLLPPGDISIGGSLVMRGSRITLKGVGADLTKVLMCADEPYVLVDHTVDCGISDMTFDRPNDYLPWTQATVDSLGTAAASGNTIKLGITIDPDYQELTSEMIKKAEEKADGVWITLRDVGGKMYNFGYTRGLKTSENIAGSWKNSRTARRWDIYVQKKGGDDNDIQYFLGQRITLGMQYGKNALLFKYPINTLVKNVNLYAGGGMGAYGALGGDATFDNVKIIANNSAGRLCSCTADAVHFNSVRGVFTLKNSTIGQCGDDLLNNGAYSCPVTKTSGASVSYHLDDPIISSLWFEQYKVGDRIELHRNGTNAEGGANTRISYLGQARIGSVDTGGKNVTLTFDPGFNDPNPSFGTMAGDSVVDREACANQMVITDNNFQHHRGRGLRIHGVGALIQRNIFTDQFAGVTLFGYISAAAANVTIKGNSFSGSRSDTPGLISVDATQQGTEGVARASSHKIIDNTFTAFNAANSTVKPICLKSADFVYLSGNSVGAASSLRALIKDGGGNSNIAFNYYDIGQQYGETSPLYPWSYLKNTSTSLVPFLNASELTWDSSTNSWGDPATGPSFIMSSNDRLNFKPKAGERLCLCWTAPRSGKVNITGDAYFAEAQRGAGVYQTIYKNEVLLTGAGIAINKGNPVQPCNRGVDVVRGDKIYLQIGKGQGGDYEVVSWAPVVTYVK